MTVPAKRSDARGDVIAVGSTLGGGADAVTVVKLASASGELVWRRDLTDAWRASDMALDHRGDVVVALSTNDATGNSFGVTKVAGTTGGREWLVRETDSMHRWQEAMAVVVDPAGAVFAAGMTKDGTGDAAGRDGYTFTVVRLGPGRVPWTGRSRQQTAVPSVSESARRSTTTTSVRSRSMHAGSSSPGAGSCNARGRGRGSWGSCSV